MPAPEAVPSDELRLDGVHAVKQLAAAVADLFGALEDGTLDASDRVALEHELAQVHESVGALIAGVRGVRGAQ